MLVVAVGVVVAVLVAVGSRCWGSGGCAVVVVVIEELIYYFNVL